MPFKKQHVGNFRDIGGSVIALAEGIVSSRTHRYRIYDVRASGQAGDHGDGDEQGRRYLAQRFQDEAQGAIW